MDYFKNMRLVKYDFTTTEETKQIFTLTDITTRVFAHYDNPNELLQNYIIKDWDTPEKLSFDLYGTTEFYWTILYINGIADLFSDWPLKGEELTRYAEKLYPAPVASRTNEFPVQIKWYPIGTTLLSLPKINTVSINPIYPNKVIPGTFVDPSVAGKGCTVVSSVNNLNSVDIVISRPTYLYPSADGTDAIFYEFAESTDGYQEIEYFTNSIGVIKDLDAKKNNETIFAITHLDKLTIDNEKKRRIKVIRPNRVVEFATKYFRKVI